MVGPGVPGMGAENQEEKINKEEPLIMPEAPAAPEVLAVPSEEVSVQEKAPEDDDDPDQIDLGVPNDETVISAENPPTESHKVKFDAKIVDQTPSTVAAASEMTQGIGTEAGIAEQSEEANPEK